MSTEPSSASTVASITKMELDQAVAVLCLPSAPIRQHVGHTPMHTCMSEISREPCVLSAEKRLSSVPPTR
jgi:hypothetical protein